MIGTMLVFYPGKRFPQRLELTAAPELVTLQSAVGGLIEAVPFFTHIDDHGEERRCVALCNEHGKISEPPLPRNLEATMLWRKCIPGNLISHDYLVGAVAVLFGDDEFMEAL